MVAKLHRPSVGAWALNQVARSSPTVVAAAIEAGAQLRAASEDAVAGKPGELRAATTAERAAANAVVKEAATHLGSRAEALAPTLLATIRVAALDDDVADQLRRGVLDADQEQPGFGFGMDESPLASVTKLAPRRAAKAKATKAKADAAAKTAKGAKAARSSTKKASGRGETDPDPDDDDAAKAEAEKAERAAAREAERVRKKELTARQRTLDRKEREARRLAKEADAAEAEAQQARAIADQAQADADAAQQAVDELA